MPENPTARDGKPGCPVTVWDGPYSTRCGAGASVGKCAHHGPFATTAIQANDYQPVELTKAERAALMHHIGDWKFERQGLANAEDAFMAEVSRIVAAREAAARREALLEVRAEIDSRIEGARGIHLRNWAVEAKVKRVEALADKWDADPIELALAGMNARHDLRAALAEPEPDEEGGR